MGRTDATDDARTITKLGERLAELQQECRFWGGAAASMAERLGAKMPEPSVHTETGYNPEDAAVWIDLARAMRITADRIAKDSRDTSAENERLTQLLQSAEQALSDARVRESDLLERLRVAEGHLLASPGLVLEQSLQSRIDSLERSYMESQREIGRLENESSQLRAEQNQIVAVGDAFANGRIARAENVQASSNPFEHSEALREAWASGWSLEDEMIRLKQEADQARRDRSDESRRERIAKTNEQLALRSPESVRSDFLAMISNRFEVETDPERKILLFDLRIMIERVLGKAC